MKITSLLIPTVIIFTVLYALFKRVNVYDAFTAGASKSIPLCVSLFPYLVTIFVMTEIFAKSGLSDLFIKFLSPITTFFGIPEELTSLVILKPFSGSGSLATVNGIFQKYGADSYLARCASAIYGSSETVFYVSAVYYSEVKEKRLIKPILISLISTFISTVFACFICKVC